VLLHYDTGVLISGVLLLLLLPLLLLGSGIGFPDFNASLDQVVQWLNTHLSAFLNDAQHLIGYTDDQLEQLFVNDDERIPLLLYAALHRMLLDSCIATTLCQPLGPSYQRCFTCLLIVVCWWRYDFMCEPACTVVLCSHPNMRVKSKQCPRVVPNLPASC
jgi:hypothetical protein